MNTNHKQKLDKSFKWPLIFGGVILFIILISVFSGGEEKKGLDLAQLSQSQTSQEQQKKISLSIIKPVKAERHKIVTDKEIEVGGEVATTIKAESIIVKVNNKEVKINEEGKFAIIVPLKLGENRIEIIVDADGGWWKDEENTSISIERITQEEMAKQEEAQKLASDKIKVKTFMCANLCAMPYAIISIKDWSALKGCMNECLSANSSIGGIVEQMSINEIESRSKDFAPELFDKITKEIQKN